jgi:hypothetical protein
MASPARPIEPANQPEPKHDTTSRNEVEQVIQAIEDNQLDIATAYADWRNIGFAFADEFGEAGRELFHRISRFYHDYSQSECNRQFDNCLRAKGQGISLKTFFYHAKKAGISVAGKTASKKADAEPMPTFPKSLFPELPEFLQQVVAKAHSDEERDILLLGSIVAISACLPRIYGIYDGRKVFPNLFLFVTAQASAGKGRLVHCKQIVMPVHRELREQARLLKQQYELEMAEYNACKGQDNAQEKPSKPPEVMLIIPANNSTTGVFQLLSDSNGKGLIFETEGDTLAQAFKSDYGNYSDGFRKAFQHETISYYRRTDREYVDIESPCLSAVLSGTPGQVSALIPNCENGLFSRFIFYFMNIRPEWKNVFAHNDDQSLDDYFERLADRFFELYQSLQNEPEILFRLSPHQQEQFNMFFARIQEKYLELQGIDYIATIRRLGLIAFRICLVLTALRIMDNGAHSHEMSCDEVDFNTALKMIGVLVKHASKVFSELPEVNKPLPRKNRKEKFLNALPKSFNRKKYLEVAQKFDIPNKTAEGYIAAFVEKKLLHREHHGHYLKIPFE